MANKHKALIVEDVAESFCATVNGRQTGTFSDVGMVKWNGNNVFEIVMQDFRL